MDENLRIAKGKLTQPWERKAKWTLVGAFALTVCYKLWQTPTYFAFGFAEALSLTLAVFAVWLSLQFYYKAGEASAQTHDRIFQFIRDATLVLGRIDAALAGRPGMPAGDHPRPGVVMTAEALAAKHEELDRARAEQAALIADKDKIILDILARANLRGADVQKYFNLLAAKEQHLRDLTRRQSLLEQQLLEIIPGQHAPLDAPQSGLLQTVGKKTG